MTENFKVQVSTKIGGDMINFRGESAGEVAQSIDDFALLASNILDNLKIIQESGKDLVAAQRDLNTAGQAVAAPQAAPASAGAPAQSPAGGAPQCPHGNRVFKSAPDGSWKAYFCSLPKGTPGACAPEWVR